MVLFFPIFAFTLFCFCSLFFRFSLLKLCAVPFRNRERITFDHLVSMKKPDEIAEVRVLRDGVEHEFRISLRPVSLFRMSLRFYLVMSIGFYLYMCAYAFILEMHIQSGIFVQNDQAILK